MVRFIHTSDWQIRMKGGGPLLQTPYWITLCPEIYAELYGLTEEELRYILDPKGVYGSASSKTKKLASTTNTALNAWCWKPGSNPTISTQSRFRISLTKEVNE